MKLIKFTGGTAGVPVWINPDAVVAVQGDADTDSKLTVITTQDGKEHGVQETMDVVLKNLQS